ncbi:MAG: hypothetical protein KGN84_06485 [Acidobacteriota bacterium]|nr:hypothetical protein [Acidobacteriota bacterium]
MCHQSVGLIQSVIEKAGIPTVSISLLREVTEKVRPPRVLAVDAPLGYPLIAPRDAALQKRIIEAALALLSETPPISQALEPFQ